MLSFTLFFLSLLGSGMIGFVQSDFGQASGLDLQMRGDIVEHWDEIFYPLIQDYLTNTIDGAPTQKGNHWVVRDYELSDFDLGDVKLAATSEGFTYQFSVTKLKLSYEIKISFLETCTWKVTFSNKEDLPLLIPFQLDLSGNTPVFTSEPSWSIGMSGINIDVDCLSTLCDLNAVCLGSKDPVKDNSYDTFEKGWLAIPGVIGDFLNGEVDRLGVENYPLVLEFDIGSKQYSLGLDLRGTMTSVSTTPSYQNLETPSIFSSGEFFIVSKDTGVVTNPPFRPTIAPTSVLYDPPFQLMFYMTDFFFHSLVWSLEASGFLDRTILPEMVPSNSPFQLSTDDPVLLSIAPGLLKYGNSPMALSLLVSPYANTTFLDITPTGISSFYNHVQSDYYLYNETSGEKGKLLFSLLQEFSFNISIELDSNQTSLTILMGLSGIRIGSTTTLSSDVGRINDDVATKDYNEGLFFADERFFSDPLQFSLPFPNSIFISPPGIVFTDADYLYGGGSVYSN